MLFKFLRFFGILGNEPPLSSSEAFSLFLRVTWLCFPEVFAAVVFVLLSILTLLREFLSKEFTPIFLRGSVCDPGIVAKFD